MQEQVTDALPEDPSVEEGPRGPGWGWGDLLKAAAVTVVGGVLLLLVARVVIAVTGLQVEERLVSPVFYAVGLGIYLSAVLGVYLFAVRRAGWAAVGLRGVDWQQLAIVPPLFVLGLTVVALVNLGVARVAGGFENPQVEALTGGQALAPGEIVLLLLLVAVVVPFAEELFFRGMLYPLLRARLGAAMAIGLNGALFALAHVVPLLLPGLFVVGVILAFLRERSGSIWPPVFYHSMQNATALLLINAALGQVS